MWSVWIVNKMYTCCYYQQHHMDWRKGKGSGWGQRTDSRRKASKHASVLGLRGLWVTGQVDKKVGQIYAGSENRFGKEPRQSRAGSPPGSLWKREWGGGGVEGRACRPFRITLSSQNKRMISPAEAHLALKNFTYPTTQTSPSCCVQSF